VAVCLLLQKSGGTAVGPSTTYIVVRTLATQDVTDYASCELVGTSGAEWARMQSTMATVEAAPWKSASTGAGVPADVDPLLLGQFFGFAFASTVTLWAVAYGAGQVISFIRRA
jgi:hypothetical protein